MLAHRLNPILNVSNIRDSFAGFEKLGWTKGWDWGDPPTFGGSGRQWHRLFQRSIVHPVDPRWKPKSTE